MKLTKMAWRNLRRAHRRTIVTVAAMSLALVTMIAYSGLVQGYMRRMKENIVDLELGELQVHADGYRKQPSIYLTIPVEEEFLESVESRGYRVAPRLIASGLAASGDASSGIQLRGVDPARDAQVSQLAHHVDKGKWLDKSDPKGVVIGRRLAKILGVDVGGDFVLLSQAADGSMANDVFVVRGVLAAIAANVDQAGVYLLEDTFRECFVLESGYHELMIRSPPGVSLDAAQREVEEIVQNKLSDSNAKVETWRQIMVTLASMLDSSQTVMLFMFGIAYVAIGIVILNAMLMSVFERIREFGVLKAIGVGPAGVMSLVLMESFMQVLLAMGIGLGVAVPLLYYLVEHGIDLSGFGDLTVIGVAIDPVWKAYVDAEVIWVPALTMAIIVFLSVLYPAAKAAWVDPVEAMRHR